MPGKEDRPKTTATATADRPVYRVKVLHSSATEHATAGFELERGDHVIVPTRYGKALAVVLGPVRNLMEIGSGQVLDADRKANRQDLERFSRNAKRDAQAFEICQRKIEEHGLEMKLVAAHHLIGEPKVLFFFTAESRVDFRALVKDLVAEIKMRIELRQIGVRDESRVLGGMGVCGRAFCCHKLTDKLSPVSIKMAKKQDLSLNSLKISGPCGRLLCCLAYEYDYYNKERTKMPATGTRLRVDGESARVCEVNLLSRKVKVVAESGRTMELSDDQLQYLPSEKRWIVTEVSESTTEDSQEEATPPDQ